MARRRALGAARGVRGMHDAARRAGCADPDLRGESPRARPRGGLCARRRAIGDVATRKLRAAIDALIADYRLEPATLTLIGGGGGAAALIPYAAQRLGLPYRLARDAEVISPLGVALALVRDVVERNVADPTPEDLVRIRREAREAAVLSGADPERVEVAIEIDPRRNLVRAIASGATALVERAARPAASPADRLAAVAKQLCVEPA